MFGRCGVELSDQTLGGWLRQSADLLEPLYNRAKGFVLSSTVVGTDDTPVKVLDRTLPHTRKGGFGRMWATANIGRWFTITRRHGNVPGRRSFSADTKATYNWMPIQPGMEGEDLRLLRQETARPVASELHAYLLKIQQELLPKSDAGPSCCLHLEQLGSAHALSGSWRVAD